MFGLPHKSVGSSKILNMYNNVNRPIRALLILVIKKRKTHIGKTPAQKVP